MISRMILFLLIVFFGIACQKVTEFSGNDKKRLEVAVKTEESEDFYLASSEDSHAVISGSPLVVFRGPLQAPVEVMPSHALGSTRRLDQVGLVAANKMLPSIPFVQNISFAGNNYPIIAPGIYTFMTVGVGRIRNLIVIDGYSTTAIIDFLRAMSTLHIHGTANETADMALLERQMMTLPVVATMCHRMAELTQYELRKMGFVTRAAQPMSLKQRTNNDDGHYIFEMLNPNTYQWFLVDADLGMLFQVNGKLLSAGEVYDAAHSGIRPEVVPLVNSPKLDLTAFIGGYTYAIYTLWRMGTVEKAWSWYRYQLDTVMIDKTYWLGGSANALNTYYPGWGIILPDATLRAKLYPHAPSDVSDLKGDWTTVSGTKINIKQTDLRLEIFADSGESSQGWFYEKSKIYVFGITGNLESPSPLTTVNRIHLSNGQVWIRNGSTTNPNLDGTKWIVGSGPITVNFTQTNFNVLSLKASSGEVSTGRFLADGSIYAFGGLIGKITDNQIGWSNGKVWTKQ